MKKTLVVVIGILALAFASCTQDNEIEEISGMLEYTSYANRTITRSGEAGEGETPIDCENRIIRQGCDTICFGETIQVAVELRWTRGYIYVTNGVTEPMSTVSIGNVWYKSNHQGSVSAESTSTVYWSQRESTILGTIYIRGNYLTGGTNPHFVEFNYGHFVSHAAKNLHFEDEN